MDERVFHNRVEVRYAETDKSGIVSIQHYLTWLDIARDGFFYFIGAPYICSMEDKGYMLPLADYRIDFNRPVFYGQTVDVYSAITHLSSKRMIFTHRIYLQGEDPDIAQPACEAFAKLAFVSSTNFKSVCYDEEDPAMFSLLEKYLISGFSTNGGLC